MKSIFESRPENSEDALKKELSKIKIERKVILIKSPKRKAHLIPSSICHQAGLDEFKKNAF